MIFNIYLEDSLKNINWFKSENVSLQKYDIHKIQNVLDVTYK